MCTGKPKNLFTRFRQFSLERILQYLRGMSVEAWFVWVLSGEVFIFQQVTKVVPWTSDCPIGLQKYLRLLDFLLSLSQQSLCERRKASYISVLFRLTLILRCVHLHFMEEQKPGPLEIEQEQGLCLCLWLEGLGLPWPRDQEERAGK